MVGAHAHRRRRCLCAEPGDDQRGPDDHRLLAAWDAAAELALDSEPALHYRWSGQHERRHATAMGGSGTIVFDSELDPRRARGCFYDRRLTEIEGGVARQSKALRWDG